MVVDEGCDNNANDDDDDTTSDCVVEIIKCWI